MNEGLKRYLNSPGWHRRARIFKENKKFICELCGNHLLLEVVNLFSDMNNLSWNNPNINRFAESILETEGDRNQLIVAHHKSYKHLGFESYGEIAVLCKPCHTFFHESTEDRDWEKAWERTKTKVDVILRDLNNRPNGVDEFLVVDKNIGLWVMDSLGFEVEKPNMKEVIVQFDEEMEEVIEDYRTFYNEYDEYQNEYE